jgi:hypothetical protein
MSAIDELKEAERKATPAPWEPCMHLGGVGVSTRPSEDGEFTGIAYDLTPENVALVVLLRNRAADLIALAEAVRAWKVARAEESLAWIAWEQRGAEPRTPLLDAWKAKRVEAARCRDAMLSALARVDNNGEGER